VHKLILPFEPAFGAELTDTVTVAVAFVQGAVPATVYVYTPAMFVPGIKVPKLPPLRTEGPLQVPVDCGLPPSDANKFTDELLEQRLIFPLLPAFGGVFIVTVTVDVALGHGAVPSTV
jgi:hypothetical protein